MASTTFRYRARTADGAVVRGSMQAADVAGVVEQLRVRALYVTAVDPIGDVQARVARVLRIGSVPRTELLSFFRAFATLVRAGVSIARALAVSIERATDARFAEALRGVLADVEHGWPLSAALGRRPAEFPALYVAMIAAGEAGGILDDVLERLALFLEREATIGKKVRTALAYPAIVLAAAVTLVVFLVVTIVPMFATIFAGFHVELPWTTQALIATGSALGRPLPWALAGAALICGAGVVYRMSCAPAGALALDRARLRLPVIGTLVHKTITARVARMLGTLLRSGVELVTAIDVVVPVAGSPRYAHALRAVGGALREGEPLAASMVAARLFDPMVLALVRVGEEAGLVDEMLLKVAEYFESDVEATVATLSAVLEPALILVLGSIVGFIVCSVFIPLYSLIGSVSK